MAYGGEGAARQPQSRNLLDRAVGHGFDDSIADRLPGSDADQENAACGDAPVDTYELGMPDGGLLRRLVDGQQPTK